MRYGYHISSKLQADDLQLVFILAADAPSSGNLNNEPTDDQFLDAVTYDSMSSVIRQFDRNNRSQH